MKTFAEIAAGESPRIFENEAQVAHDFVYRPLFLNLMLILHEGKYGSLLRAECRFSLPLKTDIVLILSLLRFLFGKPDSSSVKGSSEEFDFVMRRSEAALDARIALAPSDAGPKGEGLFLLEKGELSFALGEKDRLYARPSGEDLIFVSLPEGSGDFYARMDEAECGEQARASRIFPGEAAVACALFLKDLWKGQPGK
jgi:hypothetical protein